MARRVLRSRLWPKPQTWGDLRRAADAARDSRALYALAQGAFGISQIPEEIAAFLAYASGHDVRVVCEIGVRKGGNSFLFLRALPRVELLVAVDTLLQNEPLLHFLARPGQRIRCLEGDSQSVAMRDAVRRAVGGALLDILFIDGDHRYAGAKRDFLLYRDLVRPGGLIVFHDILPDHTILRGVERIPGMPYSGGVYHLWRQLRPHYAHHEFVAAPTQSGFGIGVLEYAPGRATEESLALAPHEQVRE